jgi:type IV pilus assembly protein PilM
MIAFKRNKQLPIGLQLSDRSAVFVQMAGSAGKYQVHDLAYCELPYDESLPQEERDRLSAENLKRVVEDHNFKGRQVVTCLGSQELFVQNVRLPILPAEEVEKVVLWEAEERLSYPVEEAEIRHLLAGQVRQDSTVKQEAILLACRKEIVERQVSMLEQAGLVPAAIDVEPCAILRSLYRPESSSDLDQTVDHGVRAPCAYLNLGENATTVMFADRDQILFLKYISYGSHQLDLAVARNMGLALDEASRMRAIVTDSPTLNPDDEVHRSVIDAIRDSLEGMGAEIELCLRYYKVTFRGKPLDRIVITGADACPWLVDYLSQRLQTSCEFGNPLEQLEQAPSSSTALDRPGRWTTAMGLSLKNETLVTLAN